MRKLASIRQVKAIEPIAKADRIEVAVVDGWKCVVKKGEFAIGQAVIYCEIDSFLPVRPEFEFLRASSFRKMDDREGFRLKTVKLRGQVSQGLLLPVSLLPRNVWLGEDVSEELGITKYEAPIPACLNGKVLGPFPGFIPKTDEERLQNLAEDFNAWLGRRFSVTEKLDGTSMTVYFDHRQHFGVCGRNWELEESEANHYWRAVRMLNLKERLSTLGRPLALQGELVGPGIQGNQYQLPHAQWYVFNIFDIAAGRYLPKSEVRELCMQLQLKSVPDLGEHALTGTLESLLLQADGDSQLQPGVPREGLVWDSCENTQDRVSFKVISNQFLSNERD